MPNNDVNSRTEWNTKTKSYATGSRNGAIAIWNFLHFGGEQQVSVLKRLEGHQSKVTDLVWYANECNNAEERKHILASTSSDKTIRIWNAEQDRVAIY